MSLLTEGTTGAPVDLTITPAQAFTLVGFVLGALLFDRFVLNRKPRELTLRQSLLQTIFFIGLSIGFGFAVILPQYGGGGLTQYLGVWVAEYILSIDNLFILMIILKRCGIPRELHQKGLYWGINIAIVLRVALILFATALLTRISVLMLLVATYMIYVGYSQLRHGDDEGDITKAWFYRWLTRMIPVTYRTYGDKLFIRQGGRKVATLFLIAICVIGYTDLVFALDSIPTAIALSSIVYVTVAGNINGVLGLRPIYFLMGHITKYITRLNWGLALICSWIGVKLIIGNSWLMPRLGWEPVHIPLWGSLSFIFGSLAFAYLASQLWPPKETVDLEEVTSETGTMVAVYLDCGEVMDGEWRTGLMDEYLQQVLFEARHYDSGGQVPLYGFATSVVPLGTVDVAEEQTPVERPALEGFTNLAVVLHHAKETGESILGTHVAIVMTAGVTMNEAAAYKALAEMPDNTFVVFVRVSDEPGGADTLQGFDDAFTGDADRCNTIHATDDAGKPNHQIPYEIGEELDAWLNKREVFKVPA